MNTLKKCTITSYFGVILIFSLSACGTTSSVKSLTSSSPSGSPSSLSQSGSSKSPAEVLRESVVAMKQLQSTHFTLSTSTISTVTSSSSSTPEVTTTTTNADGDIVLPDQNSLETTLFFQDGKTYQVAKIGQVVKPGQAYIQTSKGIWYAFSGEPVKYVHPWPVIDDMNILVTVLPLVQDTNFADYGIENLQGQNLRHITVTLGTNVYNTLYGQLGLGTQPSWSKLEDGILDVWIDEATSYIHHMALEFKTLMDKTTTKNQVGAPSGTTETTEDLAMDFSQFNQIAAIRPPANAIPTTDPSVL